jgi:hypothetical protein
MHRGDVNDAHEVTADTNRTPLSPWLIGLATFSGVVGVGVALTQGGAINQAGPPAEIRAPAPSSDVASAEKPANIDIPSFGLSVVPVPGWHVISAQENADNLRSVKMDDRQFQELAIRYANSPVVALSKYKEPYEDLNPSFKINVRPAGAFSGRPPTEILAAALPAFRRAFSDMAIEEGPSPTKVAGHDAAYAKLAYTMKAAGAAFPTVSEIWIVPRGPIVVMVGTGTRADERNGTRAEVRQFVDRLTIR